MTESEKGSSYACLESMFVESDRDPSIKTKKEDNGVMTKKEWLEKHDYEETFNHNNTLIYEKCLDQEEEINAVIKLDSKWHYYIDTHYSGNTYDEDDLKELRKYLDIVKNDFEDMIEKCK